MFRVIVFGSRDWEDPKDRFDKGSVSHVLSAFVGYSTIVVHGACPTGADALASRWVRDSEEVFARKEEPHPADWTKHGKAAGPIRNQEMVDAGAHLALGFIRGTGSRGSEDMLRRLRKAGVLTIVTYR